MRPPVDGQGGCLDWLSLIGILYSNHWRKHRGSGLQIRETHKVIERTLEHVIMQR